MQVFVEIKDIFWCQLIELTVPKKHKDEEKGSNFRCECLWFVLRVVGLNLSGKRFVQKVTSGFAAFSFPLLIPWTHDCTFRLFLPWVPSNKQEQDFVSWKWHQGVLGYLYRTPKYGRRTMQSHECTYENCSRSPSHIHPQSEDHRLYPSITYYWTGLLILDHSISRWELDKFKNCWNKSFRTFEVLTFMY